MKWIGKVLGNGNIAVKSIYFLNEIKCIFEVANDKLFMMVVLGLPSFIYDITFIYKFVCKI